MKKPYQILCISLTFISTSASAQVLSANDLKQLLREFIDIFAKVADKSIEHNKKTKAQNDSVNTHLILNEVTFPINNSSTNKRKKTKKHGII